VVIVPAYQALGPKFNPLNITKKKKTVSQQDEGEGEFYKVEPKGSCLTGSNSQADSHICYLKVIMPFKRKIKLFYERLKYRPETTNTSIHLIKS
jgi:hypothetical protein